MARKASPWLVETKDKGDGKVYKVYVLDTDGNRIPADTPADKVAKIRAKPKEKKERVPKEPKAAKEPKEKKATVAATVRKNRKALKRVIPLAIQEGWFQKIKEGKPVLGQSEDRTDSFFAMRTVGHWILVHMVKKNQDKYFYYNPLTEKIVPFDKDVHKTGPGDESLLWPNEEGTEVNLRETDIAATAPILSEVDNAIADEENLDPLP